VIFSVVMWFVSDTYTFIPDRVAALKNIV